MSEQQTPYTTSPAVDSDEVTAVLRGITCGQWDILPVTVQAYLRLAYAKGLRQGLEDAITVLKARGPALSPVTLPDPPRIGAEVWW